MLGASLRKPCGGGGDSSPLPTACSGSPGGTRGARHRETRSLLATGWSGCVKTRGRGDGTRYFGRHESSPTRTAAGARLPPSQKMAEAAAGLLEQLKGCLAWPGASLWALWLLALLGLLYVLRAPLKLHDHWAAGERKAGRPPHPTLYARRRRPPGWKLCRRGETLARARQRRRRPGGLPPLGAGGCAGVEAFPARARPLPPPGCKAPLLEEALRGTVKARPHARRAGGGAKERVRPMRGWREAASSAPLFRAASLPPPPTAWVPHSQLLLWAGGGGGGQEALGVGLSGLPLCVSKVSFGQPVVAHNGEKASLDSQ